MSYPDSVRYLYSLGNELKAGAKFGIERMQKLLGALGNPAQYLIAQRYLESLTTIATGAQKLVFLPYEASGVMASVGGMRELFAATTATK